MLVLLTIDREVLAKAASKWRACEGVKLNERPDGTFELLLTTDLRAARDTDRVREQRVAAEGPAAVTPDARSVVSGGDPGAPVWGEPPDQA